MRVGSPQTRRKAGARSKAASMRRSERNAQERTTRGAGGIGGEGAKARGATPSPPARFFRGVWDDWAIRARHNALCALALRGTL